MCFRKWNYYAADEQNNRWDENPWSKTKWCVNKITGSKRANFSWITWLKRNNQRNSRCNDDQGKQWYYFEKTYMKGTNVTETFLNNTPSRYVIWICACEDTRWSLSLDNLLKINMIYLGYTQNWVNCAPMSQGFVFYFYSIFEYGALSREVMKHSFQSPPRFVMHFISLIPFFGFRLWSREILNDKAWKYVDSLWKLL